MVHSLRFLSPPAWTLAFWLLVFAGTPSESSDHGYVQSITPTRNSPQIYLETVANTEILVRRGLNLGISQLQSCEDIFQTAAWGPLRIGYDMIGSSGVDTRTLSLIRDTVMHRAAGYLSSALQVRQSTAPLRTERLGQECSKYNFESEYSCTSYGPAMCETVEIPAKFYRAARACTQRCAMSITCEDWHDGMWGKGWN